MAANESSATTPLIRFPGEGPFIPFGMTGNGVTLKVSAEETANRITIYGSVIQVASGRLPRHLHHQTDELFYVLEGEVTFEVAGQVQQAPKGTFLFIPQGPSTPSPMVGRCRRACRPWSYPEGSKATSGR